MNDFQKIGLIVVIILAAIYIKMAYFGSKDVIEEPVTTKTQIEEKNITKQEEPQEKVSTEYVNVFFITHNAKGEEVYRAVKREYIPEMNQGTSKLKLAVRELIKGPSEKEKKKGVYSEIPAGTRLISITEASSRVVINISGDFENGGGTDSLYKRLFQLIKTVKHNTNLPLYLQLDGKQVDVIGGEGIMITQPLNEDFANE